MVTKVVKSKKNNNKRSLKVKTIKMRGGSGHHHRQSKKVSRPRYPVPIIENPREMMAQHRQTLEHSKLYNKVIRLDRRKEGSTSSKSKNILTLEEVYTRYKQQNPQLNLPETFQQLKDFKQSTDELRQKNSIAKDSMKLLTWSESMKNMKSNNHKAYMDGITKREYLHGDGKSYKGQIGDLYAKLAATNTNYKPETVTYQYTNGNKTLSNTYNKKEADFKANMIRSMFPKPNI